MRPPAGMAAVFSFIFLSIVLGIWVARAPASAEAHPRNILVLLSIQPELPVSQAVVTGLEGALKADPNIRVYYEFLDAMRFPSEQHLDQAERYLRAKFAETRFDIAIAMGPESLDFLLGRDTGLISSSNIVFGGISEDRKLSPDRGASGILSRYDVVKTLELAQSLQPDLKRVVVVTGASPFDKSWETTARRDLAAMESKYEFSYLVGLPMGELLGRLAKLPRDSAVLYLTYVRDGENVPYIPRDVADKISRAANVPVYSVYDTYLGHGIVGGYMDTFEEVGREVGELALKRLSGQAAPGTVEPSHTHSFIVDWRELDRLGLAESRLPPETKVRFKLPSPWMPPKELIFLILAVLLGLSYLVLKFYREVKSRRLAEQAATDSRDQIELSVASANLGLWEWDPVTDKVWTSDHCRTLLGLTGEAVIPREKFLDCLQGEDRTLAVARMLKAMTTGNQCEAEYSLVQPDGSVHWLHSRAARRSRGGKPDYLLGVLMDVTERKLAEREAEEQRKQLTHLTRVSVLGALSGALAHELNQPLTAILSNAQAARRILGRKPYDIEEIRKILEDIVDDDRRAGDVIHHLRSLLRREEGARTPIDINQLAASVLDFARSDLVLRGVAVTRELNKDLPPVEGDAVQLQQVLLNLIVNACDAMSRKPVAERKLTIATKMTKKGKLRVSVVDNGEGISEDNIKTMFEPFHTTKALGLGLGLPICNWIIAAHGGKLLAHSHPEGGATFSFDLPIPVIEVTHAQNEPHSVPG
ncbi:MAG: ATP-binding protein [Parvibaculaceae bacterium]